MTGPVTQRSSVHVYLVAALLAMAVPLDAQTISDDNDPLVSANFLSIPQVSGRGYKLNASLLTRYDSNFLRSAGSGGAFRVSPLAQAGIGLPLAGQQFFVGGSVGRDIFINNTQLNRNRYSIGGGVGLRAGSRCGGTLGAEMQRRQLLQFDAVEFADNIQRRNTIGGNLQCAGSAGLGFGASAIWSDQQNSRVTRQLFDNQSFSVSPQISYTSPVFGSLSLGGSYVNIKYPNRAVLTLDGPATDAIELRSARFGLARDLGSRLNISLGISYIDAGPKPDTSLVPDFATGRLVENQRSGFTGLGYDGSLAMQLGSRLNITALGSRAARGGGNIGALFRVVDTRALDLSYQLSQSITSGIGISVIKNNIRGGFPSPDEPMRRISDTNKRIYGQLSYSPSGPLSISVEVSHRKRESNPVLFNFSNISALLRLRASFSRLR